MADGHPDGAATRELFERHGDDLFCEIPIKFTLATLGGTIEVPTLFGKAFLYSLNYAAGFILIYLTGATLATKQPAMTAPARQRTTLPGIASRDRRSAITKKVFKLTTSMTRSAGWFAAPWHLAPLSKLALRAAMPLPAAIASVPSWRKKSTWLANTGVSISMALGAGCVRSDATT